MKYALIGCGRIAINHVKAATNNNLELVAMCDIDVDKIEQLIEQMGYKKNESIDKYSDYRQMINEHPELELISIATYSGTHAEIAIYCIKHNINIIIEKPIALSMMDANMIVKMAKQYNVIVSACHQNRFNIAIQQLRKAIENNRFGKISHGSIHVRWNRDENYYLQAPWRGTWNEDGGCLMNQCIHGIDLLCWMMGDEVESVYGVLRQQQHPYLDAEDVGMAVITFKNGSVATIEGTTNVYPKNLEETLYVFGESGTVKIGGKSTNNIDIWQFKDEKEEDISNKNLEEITSNIYGNGHTSLFADVIDAILNKRKPYVDCVAGKNALEVILAIYKSAQKGEVVKLPLEDFSTKEMEGFFS